MPSGSNIGRAELQVLQYVQDHHPVTVRQVADQVGAATGVVRTTILNVMNRLVKKGFLSRRKEQGLFVYRPKVGKAQVLQSLVREFVDKALGGSVSPFMVYLAEDAELDDDDVQQLRQVLRTLETPTRKAGRKEQP